MYIAYNIYIYAIYIYTYMPNIYMYILKLQLHGWFLQLSVDLNQHWTRETRGFCGWGMRGDHGHIPNQQFTQAIEFLRRFWH